MEFENSVNTATTTASQNMMKYDVYYTTSRLNATLHLGSSSTPASYYLQSHCSLNKPQLLLRRGDVKTSPVVAFAKIRWTSRHMLFGKGDCEHDPEDKLVWEQLLRDKNAFRRSDYHFSTSEGSETNTRCNFHWRKDMSKLLQTVYDCVDEEGRPVAKLLSGGAFNWRKGGEIEVLDSLDQDLQELLLVSGLTIWATEALNYQSGLQGYGKSHDKDN